MSLLNCQNVSLSFGEREILRDVTFELAKNDRVGLIGANGCGKTTLFNIISGKVECTDGACIKAKDTVVGFVEQHACADSNRNVYDELLTVFDNLAHMEAELEEVHRKVEMTSGKVPEYIDRQIHLTEELQRLGALTYRARAHSCLKGLGFTEAEEKLPVSALSGGQRTKLSLGKLLLSAPDLLLLDEPTNHLDISSVEWLEDFMTKYQGAAVIISHDRYFLDKVTDRTLEIEAKRLFCGKGGYSVYMKNKALRLESEKREYDKAAAEIKRLEQMIEQQKQFNRERNYITIASKEKQIERIRDTMPVLPPKERKFKLKFEVNVRSGDEVLIAENLKKEYEGKLLFDNVSLTVYRGEKVFLLGPNGCGKSTLLNMLINKVPKDAGLSRFGHGVQVGYFDQTQRALMSDKSILMEIYDTFPTLTVPEIRSYLGAFNFRNDDIEKRMCDLSGGERARVALLELILKKPNFLILDEPTNHLDILSREVLEQALDAYEGTLLCVSHDRYFVNRIATKILSFNGTSIDKIDGNYDDYVRMLASPEKLTQTQVKKPNDYKLRKENESRERKRLTKIAKLEEEIARTEAEKEKTAALLSTPETSSDYEKVLELTDYLSELTAKADELTSEWLELSEE